VILPFRPAQDVEQPGPRQVLRRLFAVEGDAGAAGEQLEGFEETDVLVLLDELEDVAVLAADQQR